MSDEVNNTVSTNNTDRPTATTTPKKKKGTTRPGDGDILVLLVGINDYQLEKVPDLAGCINDLNKVENWLKTRFQVPKQHANESILLKNGENGETLEHNAKSYLVPEEGYTNLKILRLEDDLATYDNIILAFEKFLTQAREIDRVWFHFSGHGVQAPTAKEFAKLENNKDQCLMCHDFETDVHGKLKNLLADKELAVLLNNVAKGDGKPPHIVVTLDCCHSGGGTRDFDFNDPIENVRQIRAEDLVEGETTIERRTLSDYLYGKYYSETNLDLPSSPHLVLTACDNLQLAGEGLLMSAIETDKIHGGFFTTGLINALDKKGQISYADLLIETRHKVREQRGGQTPQFEAIGGGKPYTRFLEGTPAGDPDKFEVKYYAEKWIIGCGAIHGLPTTAKINAIAASSQPVEVTITDKDGKEITTGAISEVGPQFSYLTGVETELKDKVNDVLYGTLNYLPADSVFVLLKGTETAISKFQEDWDSYEKMKEMNIHYLSETAEKVPHITINITETQYKIIHGTEQLDRVHPLENADRVLLDIVQIVRYERLLTLENSASSTLKDKVTLSLSIGVGEEGLSNPLLKDKSDSTVIFIAKEAEKIKNDRSKKDKRFYHLYPKITIKGADEPVYCYLLKLYTKYYRIQGAKKENGIKDGEIEFGYNSKWNTGIDPEENQYILNLKLLVSEEKLDIHQFYQEGLIPNTKGFEEDMESVESGFKDWCTIDMKLVIVREEEAATFLNLQESAKVVPA